MDRFRGERTGYSDGGYAAESEIDDMVEEYIAAGGRIMIDHRGKLQHQLRLSALLGRDAQAATDFATSFEAMAKNKKRSAQLAQLVQDFGSVNEAGWVILERSIAPGDKPD